MLKGSKATDPSLRITARRVTSHGARTFTDEILIEGRLESFGFTVSIPARENSIAQLSAIREGAEAGLAALQNWMSEIGVVQSASELGVTEDMIEGIADATFLLTGGYKTLTREEVIQILRESM